MVCVTSKASEQPAHMLYSMTVKLLKEHHLEFLSLKRGYTSTLVKMPMEITCHGSYVKRFGGYNFTLDGSEISQRCRNIKGVLSSVPTHGFSSNFAY